jgi:hypothetical protein
MYCVVYVLLYCVVLLYSVVLSFFPCTRVGLLPPGANPIAVKNNNNIESVASNNSVVACIRCVGKVFTELLPSTEWRYKFNLSVVLQLQERHTYRQRLIWRDL